MNKQTILSNLEESLISCGSACIIKTRRKAVSTLLCELKCAGCVPHCSKEPFLGAMLFLYNFTNIHCISIFRQIFYHHLLQRLKVSWYVSSSKLFTSFEQSYFSRQLLLKESEEIISLLTCLTKCIDGWVKSHDGCFLGD